MDYELLAELENLHSYFSRLYGKVKVGINSGFRCYNHNASAKVRGAENSQHLNGRGVDLVVYRMGLGADWEQVPGHIVANYLEDQYPGKYGIGRYNGRTHFDTRSDGPARWSVV